MYKVAMLAAVAAIAVSSAGQAAEISVGSLPYQHTVSYVLGAADSYTFSLSGTENIDTSVTTTGLSAAGELLFEQTVGRNGKTKWTEIAGGAGIGASTIDQELTAGKYKLVVAAGSFGVGSYTVHISAVPIPAALPLFGGAVAGLLAVGRRRRSKKAAQV